MTTTSAHKRDLNLKISLRRQAYSEIGGEQYIYAPYCGFGDCAFGVPYESIRVFGCDIDHDAVRHWHRQRPKARIVAERAERFAVWPLQPVGLIDLDPYGNGLYALDRALEHAILADPLQVVITEGSIEKMARSGTPYDFDNLRFGPKATDTAKAQYENWVDWVGQWLRRYCERVRLRQSHQVRQMRYWWFTLHGLPNGSERLGIEYNEALGQMPGQAPIPDGPEIFLEPDRPRRVPLAR